MAAKLSNHYSVWTINAPKINIKDLVNLWLTEASINKGIHRLLEQDYLELTIDPEDNRVSIASYASGKKYAKKMAPLFEIEKQIAQKWEHKRWNS